SPAGTVRSSNAVIARNSSVAIAHRAARAVLRGVSRIASLVTDRARRGLIVKVARSEISDRVEIARSSTAATVRNSIAEIVLRAASAAKDVSPTASSAIGRARIL